MNDVNEALNTRIRRVESDLAEERRANHEQREKMNDHMSRQSTCLTEIKTILQAQVCKTIDEHHETLYGNGGPGLKTTVDRHDQFVSSARWAIGLIGAGLIALIVKALWAAIITAPPV